MMKNKGKTNLKKSTWSSFTFTHFPELLVTSHVHLLHFVSMFLTGSVLTETVWV